MINLQPVIDLFNAALKGKYEMTGEQALQFALLVENAETSIREIAQEIKKNGNEEPTEESE